MGSASSYFIGPEVPGQPAEETSFKSGGLIRPQAARFRIWEYVETGGKYAPSREITLNEPDVDSIEWEVYVANRKASFREFNELEGETADNTTSRNSTVLTERRKKLEIDPGPRTIKGGVAGPVLISPKNPGEKWATGTGGVPVITYIGELRTEPTGRLIFVGGKGIARSPSGVSIAEAADSATGGDFANHDDWFDDVSDGYVKVTLKMKVGKKQVVTPVDVTPAWVLVGPPDYSPQLRNVVTLYDVLYDLAATQMTLPTNDAAYDVGGELASLSKINDLLFKHGRMNLRGYVPSFDREIYPILKAADDATWVFEPAAKQHAILGRDTRPSIIGLLADNTKPNTLRQTIFARLRTPPGMGGPSGDMPRLCGDELGTGRTELALTRTQYLLMKEWAKGHFISGSFPPSAPPPAVTPYGLDRAALENCVGGAFCPGIEVGWQIRNKRLFAEPFRIDPKAKSQYKGAPKVTIAPGHFSRQMALPWHTDFFNCFHETRGSNDDAWWPAQRPNSVYTTASDAAAKANMKSWTRPNTAWPGGTFDRPHFHAHWEKFGFVVFDRASGAYLEKDRSPGIP